MIKDDQFYQDQKNFTRNDSGLGPNGQNVGIAQENIRQDVNGSTDKPFPQERNWVFDAGATSPNSMTSPIPITEPLKQYAGQVKYARREGAPSIYKDVSRQTADDRAATRRAEKEGSIFEPEIEEEEGDAGL